MKELDDDKVVILTKNFSSFFIIYKTFLQQQFLYLFGAELGTVKKYFQIHFSSNTREFKNPKLSYLQKLYLLWSYFLKYIFQPTAVL